MKLTYFAFPGRAECIRLCLGVGGIAFEDEKLVGPVFAELKPSLPYGQVPVLEVDGVTYAQSYALLRYAGKLTGMYPTNNIAALQVDECLDANTELFNLLLPTFREKDEAVKKATREELAAGQLLDGYTKLDARIKLFGSPGFCVGKSLTIADLALYTTLNNFRSGNFDYIPPSFVEKFPNMLAVLEQVEKNPDVVAYKASRSS